MTVRQGAVLRRVRHAGRLAHRHRARGRARFSRRSATRSTGSPSPMPGATNTSRRMEEVRAGRIPFCKLDVLHRRNLERILPRFGISGLAEETSRRSQSRLASARCLARRAAGPGAAQAALHAGAGLERQHLADGRSRAPQRSAVGRDPGRGDRAATTSRSRASISPPAKRFDLPPGDCMMVGRAHQRSCRPRPSCGLRTGHSRGRTSTARARAKPRRRRRSTSRRAAWKTWPPSSARDARMSGKVGTGFPNKDMRQSKMGAYDTDRIRFHWNPSTAAL